MPRKAKISGQILNREQMAGHLGCSVTTLDRYVGAGCPIISHGKTRQGHQFDSAAVIAWVKARGAAASPEADSARQRHRMAQAELAELRLAQKREELVPLDAVKAQWADECVRIRSRLMQIPSRLAGQIAILSDAAEIEAAIDAEVRAALTELSA